MQPATREMKGEMLTWSLFTPELPAEAMNRPPWSEKAWMAFSNCACRCRHQGLAGGA